MRSNFDKPYKKDHDKVCNARPAPGASSATWRSWRRAKALARARADERRAPTDPPTGTRSPMTAVETSDQRPKAMYPRKFRSLPPPAFSGSGEPGRRTRPGGFGFIPDQSPTPGDSVRNQRQQNPAPTPGANQNSASQRNRPRIRRARRAVRTVEQERARIRNRRINRRMKRRAHRAAKDTPSALRLATHRFFVPGTRRTRTRTRYISAKGSASSLPQKISKTRKLPIWNFNIESIMVTGKLAEMLYMMTKGRILIAGLTEAGCKDTAVYNSGEYVILQSGATADRNAGVLFVVHRSLEACIQTFTPISGRVATLILRTTGGSTC